MKAALETNPTLTVSQLNRQVKRLLEGHFGTIWVEGELSNFVQAASGHWYFSLKDSDCQVRCAMFRGNNRRLKLQPGNGDLVKIRARVSLYEGRGEFQLIAEYMEAGGSGALQLAFEKLKRQLEAEGLFDAQLKQALPQYPCRIGVITSPTGAAVRDILSVFRRRFPALEIAILPVPVQGVEAAPAICRALELANHWHRQGAVQLDALILGRGGGSIEDLWAFNEETVARAIGASELPVVSAVGHEIDFTIADFVADARAPTPSAAAELLSPSSQQLQQEFDDRHRQIFQIIRRQLAQRTQQVLFAKRGLRHPGERLQEQFQRLDGLDMRLRRGALARVRVLSQALSLLRIHLARLSPAGQLQQHASQLPHLRKRAHAATLHSLVARQNRLASLRSRLESLGPGATLNRGYAIVTDSNGGIVRNASTLAADDLVHTRLANGGFSSRVTGND